MIIGISPDGHIKGSDKVNSASVTQSSQNIGQTNDHLNIPAVGHNGDTSSSVRVTKHRPDMIRSRRTNPGHMNGHIPRPRNSWIIYRGDKTRELRDKDPSLTASDICSSACIHPPRPLLTSVARITSRLWAEEFPHIKTRYQQMAQDEANNHMAKYPDYRYRARRPMPRHSKVDSLMFWEGLQDNDKDGDVAAEASGSGSD